MCSASVVLPEPVWPTNAARSVGPGISESNATRFSAVACGIAHASDKSRTSLICRNFLSMGQAFPLRAAQLQDDRFERVHDRVQLFIRRSDEIALREYP